LGLFASEQQATDLFYKYDTNKSGNLSVHEFWVAARPPDYRSLPGFDKKQEADEMVMNRARKRMYIKESLLHTSVEPPTPPRSVYSLPIERLLAGIRDKIRQNSMVDRTLSAPQTRRYLKRLFEYGDYEKTGIVTGKGLERVLATINYAMPDHYVTAFCEKFPGPRPDTCDYNKLCFAVYPLSNQNVLTSGYGQQSHHDRGVARRVLADRFENSQTSRPSTTTPYASGSVTSRTHSHSRPSSNSNRPVSSQGQGQQTARRSGSAQRSFSRPGSRSGPPGLGSQTSRQQSRQSQQAPGPRPPSQSRRVRPVSRQYMAQAATVGS